MNLLEAEAEITALREQLEDERASHKVWVEESRILRRQDKLNLEQTQERVRVLREALRRLLGGGGNDCAICHAVNGKHRQGEICYIAAQAFAVEDGG